jgi:hypothetical protein
MISGTTSHRANPSHTIVRSGNGTKPSESPGYLLGRCSGSRNVFHHDVPHPTGDKVAVNFGNTWCAIVVGCHFIDVLLSSVFEVNRPLATIFNEVFLLEAYATMEIGLVTGELVFCTECNDIFV